MRGSSYPASDDSFASINEGTSAFTANIPNEVGAAFEAIAHLLGGGASNLTSIGGADLADVATLLEKLTEYEVGTFTLAASTASTAVVFGKTSMFTATPKVFLMDNAPNDGGADQTVVVGSRTTAGFTAYRNTGSSGYSTALAFTYFAINWSE